ncbi:hypothetical protein PoB_005891600 [Plakobranchus ocellatus]|uniref:Uncharacterized protein n=1 Tax=Plakobranchus ocellatus TaxID=259542 RepID=A0AAV4CAT8_9GAST|nr:hypothetical protein PoB_005891600 [Plakobranchus ocellatus]
MTLDSAILEGDSLVSSGHLKAYQDLSSRDSRDKRVKEAIIVPLRTVVFLLPWCFSCDLIALLHAKNFISSFQNLFMSGLGVEGYRELEPAAEGSCRSQDRLSSH